MPRMKGDFWMAPNNSVGARVPIHFATPMATDCLERRAARRTWR